MYFAGVFSIQEPDLTGLDEMSTAPKIGVQFIDEANLFDRWRWRLSERFSEMENFNGRIGSEDSPFDHLPAVDCWLGKGVSIVHRDTRSFGRESKEFP